MQRILTAAIAIPLVLAALFAPSGLWFEALVLLAVELAALELAALASAGANSRAPWLVPFLVPPLVLALVRAAPPAADGSAALLVLWLVVVAAGAAVLAARGAVDGALAALGAIAFGVPYLAFPAAAIVVLQRRDPMLVLLLLALVWAADSAAFYAGRTIGGPKLAPVVSPNKTWAGFGGSVVGALAVGLVWGAFEPDGIDLRLCAIVVAAAAVGQLGDLVESLLKRAVGVKDSGRLLPGHGGVLDRLDSLFFAAPGFLLLLAVASPARLAAAGPPASFLLEAIGGRVG